MFFDIVVCKLFSVWKCLKFDVWERLKCRNLRSLINSCAECSFMQLVGWLYSGLTPLLQLRSYHDYFPHMLQQTREAKIRLKEILPQQGLKVTNLQVISLTCSLLSHPGGEVSSKSWVKISLEDWNFYIFPRTISQRSISFSLNTLTVTSVSVSDGINL